MGRWVQGWVLGGMLLLLWDHRCSVHEPAGRLLCTGCPGIIEGIEGGKKERKKRKKKIQLLFKKKSDLCISSPDREGLPGWGVGLWEHPGQIREHLNVSLLTRDTSSFLPWRQQHCPPSRELGWMTCRNHVW